MLQKLWVWSLVEGMDNPDIQSKAPEGAHVLLYLTLVVGKIYADRRGKLDLRSHAP